MFKKQSDHKLDQWKILICTFKISELENSEFENSDFGISEFENLEFENSDFETPEYENLELKIWN